MNRNTELVEYLTRVGVYEQLSPDQRRGVAAADPAKNAEIIKRVDLLIGLGDVHLPDLIDKIVSEAPIPPKPSVRTERPPVKSSIKERLINRVGRWRPFIKPAAVYSGSGLDGGSVSLPSPEDEVLRTPLRRMPSARSGETSPVPGILFAAAVLLLLVIAVLNLTKTGTESTSLLKGVREPLKVTMAPILLFGVLIMSFLEALLRKELLVLDFWICPATVGALMIFDRAYSNLGKVSGIEEAFKSGGLSLGILGISLALLIVAMVTNQSERGHGKLSWLDTTPLYITAGLLIFLHFIQWEKLPYPEFLPIWIPYSLFAAGMIREIFRTPVLSLIGLVLGAATAFSQNVSFFLLGLLITLVLTTVSSKVGWVTSPRSTEIGVTIPVVGVPMIPMDTFIMQLFAFGLISIWLQGGNYVWFTIG